MEKKTYLIIAIILIVLLIVLIMRNYNKNDNLEHMSDTPTNTGNDLKQYITMANLPSTEKAKKIKLKWVNPTNNMTYYLGAVPKSKIDDKCEAFNFVNRNSYTIKKDGTNPGIMINADYLLVFVNQYYIQPSDCKTNNNCTSSKIDETHFNFILKEYPASTDYGGNKLYSLVFTPEDENNEYIVSFIKHPNIIDDKGNVNTYGNYMSYLSIVKQSNESAVSTTDKLTKSFTLFNIENIYDQNQTFIGFKIYYDRVPIFNDDRKNILGTSRKYVGYQRDGDIPPCQNITCTLKCNENDKKCIKCCSADHKYVSLYDTVFNVANVTDSPVVIFQPEMAELFKLRYVSIITNCAYDPSIESKK